MIRYVALVVCVFALPGAAWGQEPKPPAVERAGALDLIPADAVAAIAVRNMAELITRGEVLIKEGELKLPPGAGLPEGYNWLVDYLEVRRGLDDRGSAALMLLKPLPSLNDLVVIVPVADFDEMAANFKLTGKDLAEGKVVDRGAQKEFKPRYLMRLGQHLAMSGSTTSLETLAKARTLAATLAPEDRTSLAQDDILLYANPRRMEDIWLEALRIRKEDLARFPAGELPTLRRVADAIDDLQYVVGGLRLDGGVGAAVLLELKGQKSRDILTPLAGSNSPTSLAGLPAGRVLSAHATSGGGQGPADLARDLAQYWLMTAQFNAQPLVSTTQSAGLAGVLGEMWERLEGSRSALYENENPERDGHFSLVAVLDTADAERFVADMTGLTPFVNASLLAPDKEGPIDAKMIDALVAQLGDENFQVRDLANTKLALVGVGALPALEKAAGSSDAEVKFRAAALREQILGSKANLLEKDLLSQIRPSFAYFPKQETRAGRPVDIVQLRLPPDDAEYVPQLRRLLGPEWSKVRLATVGKRVVVLAGSDTALLEAAITQVKSNEKGLEGDPSVSAFRARAPAGQTAELHVSLGRWLELLRPAVDQPQAKRSATSLGFKITPQRVRMQFFAPTGEIQSVVRQQ
jgi:hypothetical protein